MLTPDEFHLDRRIAQEAGSLATMGWSVDIYPAVDPALDYDASFAAGVRMLPAGAPARSRGLLRRALRGVRQRVAPIAPPIDRLVEATRYRLRDLADEIMQANLARTTSLGPYDLVVAHDVPVFPLAATLKRRWGARMVCDLHEIFPEQDEHFTTSTARRYWRSVERGGLEAADGIICVNAAIETYVHDRYAPTAPTVVVHNSMPFVDRADLSGRTIRDFYEISNEDRIMLFAGSLRPYANLEALIGGFGRAGIAGWSLAILGDGPLRAVLTALVERLGLQRRVFLGQRAPQSELLQVAASADLGLLPYQAVGINHEIATPNKLFEYIQARLPMATSRLPMIQRIVEGCAIGGFVDFSSEASTASGLKGFIDGELGTVSRDALDAAAVRYSWEREEPALLSVVDSAMTPEPR